MRTPASGVNVPLRGPKRGAGAPGVVALPLLHPRVADLLVFAFHRRPGDAEGGFLLARVVPMGGVGVIERLAKNVLCVLGQMRAHRWRQVGVLLIGHGRLHG